MRVLNQQVARGGGGMVDGGGGMVDRGGGIVRQIIHRYKLWTVASRKQMKAYNYGEMCFFLVKLDVL